MSAEQEKAAALLAGQLPPDLYESENKSGFKHYGSFQKAVEAYCRGDDIATAERLKAVPFHSPFQEPRLILRALSLAGSDPGKAFDVLNRIAADSPFSFFAQVIRVALQPPQLLVIPEPPIGEGVKPALARLLGIQIKGLVWVLEVIRNVTTSGQLFGQLMEGVELFDREAFNRIHENLLIHCPSHLSLYGTRNFELTSFQCNQISALALEQERLPQLAIGFWQRAIADLEKDDGTEHGLALAMIRQRQVTLAEDLKGEKIVGLGQVLEAGLQDGAFDKGTYLMLISCYQQEKEYSNVLSCIAASLKAFPDDPDLLLAAAESSFHAGEYSVAMNYAAGVLKQDAINTGAQRILIDACVFDVRDKTATNRPDLAGQRLEAAVKIIGAKDTHGIINIYRGLLAYLQGNNELFELYIEQACRQAESFLLGYFQVVVEGNRLGLPVRKLKTYSGLLKQLSREKPERRVFLKLTSLISRYQGEPDVSLDLAFAPLQKVFKQALALEWSVNDIRNFCALLESQLAYDLLKKYADQGIRKASGPTLFSYYRIVAKTRGEASRMLPADLEIMQQLMEKLQKASDTLALAQISEFLGPLVFDLVEDPEWLEEKVIETMPFDVLLNEVKQRIESDGDRILADIDRPVAFQLESRFLNSDPFEILGVNADVTDDEVKQAYLQRVREKPPEQDAGNFQNVRRAYEAIATERARMDYRLFHSEQVSLKTLMAGLTPRNCPKRLNESTLQTLWQESLKRCLDTAHG